MDDKHYEQTDKDFNYILDHTDDLAALIALAEEANELSQAALKYIRALGLVKHPTPVSVEDAKANFKEELGDLDICLRVVQCKKLVPTGEFSGFGLKLNRWANRLREVEKNEQKPNV